MPKSNEYMNECLSSWPCVLPAFQNTGVIFTQMYTYDHTSKRLLTEWEVCMGKYFLRFFCMLKTEGNTFLYRPSIRG